MMYSRMWGGWRFPETTESLSIIDLLKYGTVDARLAALLWLLMDYRASVLVAAGPSFAGKTTLLNALLDFLRPEVQQVYLQGYAEDFKFLERTKPNNTYLVADELSNHSYEYLWGYRARKTFELLPRGYAIGGTIHARNAKEVVYILHEYLGLPLALLGRLDAVVTLRIIPGKNFDDEPQRRVEAVSVINPTGNGLSIETLAAWNPKNGGFNFAADEALRAVLANKFPTRHTQVSSELAARERFLSQLRRESKHSRDEILEAIWGYYQSPHS